MMMGNILENGLVIYLIVSKILTTGEEYFMFEYDIIQSLNELELSVYEYIMKNREKVMYMKIRDLANEAHVSTTTVLRFCKKVKCEGFSEFKFKFKMYLEDNPNREINEDASIIIENLKRIANKDYDEKIEQLCNLVIDNDNVIFLGGGLSGIAGKYGARYMSSIGKFAMYVDDLLFPYHTCEHYKNALIIVLSVSGETSEIIDAINKFKKADCIIASITNSENSTIAKISDFNISYYMQEERLGAVDITSHLPPIYILEALGKRLYNKTLAKKKNK